MQFFEDEAWKLVSTQKEDVETIVFILWYFIKRSFGETMEKSIALPCP